MEHWASDLFTQYAYSPVLVYGGIWGFMILSAFGLPLPEEVVLISSGFVGYMSLHPDQFPAPYPGAPRVNVYVLSIVALGAVVASDFVIYFLGYRYGRKLLEGALFKKIVTPARLEKVRGWTGKHGYWMIPVFRLTPGIRFPGHLMCGMMELRMSLYLAIDSAIALVTVPTQILLISRYGQEILENFSKFKTTLLIVAASCVAIFFIYKAARKKSTFPQHL